MGETITEIDKDTFWVLIDQAREEFGQDLDAAEKWLVEQLVSIGPEQAQNFHDIMYGYQDLAYQYGLWTAASVMCNGCTDDGFTDFRAWLIYQGKDAYLTALADPDSLADVPAYGGCRFESLSYVGGRAYEKLTGQDVYDGFSRDAHRALTCELKQGIVYGEGVNYPYDHADIPAYLPRLCARHLTPEGIRNLTHTRHCAWNLDLPEILTARRGSKSSRVTEKNTRRKREHER